MGLGRAWWPWNETVTAEEPCGSCGYAGPVHLGWAPTGGLRFMGFQIIKTNKEDIAVCGRCGLAQHMGTQGRQEALRTDSWAIVGTGGVGYIDVNTGRLKKRPLA